MGIKKEDQRGSHVGAGEEDDGDQHGLIHQWRLLVRPPCKSLPSALRGLHQQGKALEMPAEPFGAV